MSNFCNQNAYYKEFIDRYHDFFSSFLQGYNPGLVKVEQQEQFEDVLSHPGSTFSPSPNSLNSMATSGSPGSPASPGSYSSCGGGGKMKSPSRKKSTCSNSGVTTQEEDDISNLPSLEMRIQVISQRVCVCLYFVFAVCGGKRFIPDFMDKLVFNLVLCFFLSLESHLILLLS